MATLAKAQTLYRVALSAGLIAAPRLFGRIWSGREADDARGRRDDGGRSAGVAAAYAWRMR